MVFRVQPSLEWRNGDAVPGNKVQASKRALAACNAGVLLDS